MPQRSGLAGGFFLMVAILVGTGWGIAQGNPLAGALTGTAIGVAAAVLLWLRDRRRR